MLLSFDTGAEGYSGESSWPSSARSWIAFQALPMVKARVLALDGALQRRLSRTVFPEGSIRTIAATGD
jgi:hypothetical protein